MGSTRGSHCLKVTFLCFLKVLPLMGIFVKHINSYICAFCMFFNYITTQCSLYITILFGVDKCLAVYFPFKYRQYGKPKACIISTAIVYLLIGLYCSHALFIFRVDPETGNCRPYDFSIIGTFFFYEIRPYSGSMIAGFIPLFLSAVITIFTVIKIKIASAKRSAAQNRDQLKTRRDSEITRQMIVVCSLFCFLCAINTTIVRVNYSIDVNTAREQMIASLLDRMLSNSVAAINSANFYIYVIFGRKFRSNFVSLFTRDIKSGQTTRPQ